MVISITRRSMYIVCWHRNRSQMFSDDFLVELGGLEPPTSSMPLRRSPS